jgi:hypothetical protein
MGGPHSRGVGSCRTTFVMPEEKQPSRPPWSSLVWQRRWWIALATLFILAWWLVPPLLYRHTGTTEDAKLRAITDTRTALLAGLIGVGALLTFWLNSRVYRITARTLEVTEQGHITDRYTKAIEQLGSDKLDVRLGGIYALERIAVDSKRDHPTVVEVLGAFVREGSRRHGAPRPKQSMVDEAAEKPDATAPGTDAKPRPATDVQAALSVLGRLPQQPNVSRGDLTGAQVAGAHLGGANLTSAQLAGADLSGARLYMADLTSALLGGADLSGATLAGAKSDRRPARRDEPVGRLASRSEPVGRLASRSEPDRRPARRGEPDECLARWGGLVGRLAPWAEPLGRPPRWGDLVGRHAPRGGPASGTGTRAAAAGGCPGRCADPASGRAGTSGQLAAPPASPGPSLMTGQCRLSCRPEAGLEGSQAGATSAAQVTSWSVPTSAIVQPARPAKLLSEHSRRRITRRASSAGFQATTQGCHLALATVRGRAPWSPGSAAPRRAELGRACPDSHPSWRPPAMGVLSGFCA